MFSLNKRFIACLLIIAMTISNAGMSTLAVSISHYVDEANQNAKDDSDITYRYYEEYRYSYESRTTLLMNSEADDDGGSQNSPVQGEGDESTRRGEFNEPGQDKASDGAEKSGASDEETGISEETDSSDFDVENKSENNEDKESVVSPEETDDEGARETRPYKFF